MGVGLGIHLYTTYFACQSDLDLVNVADNCGERHRLYEYSSHVHIWWQWWDLIDAQIVDKSTRVLETYVLNGASPLG